jgi:signal transduction histidine kinase/CheY-like chemotaxis protein
VAGANQAIAWITADRTWSESRRAISMHGLSPDRLPPLATGWALFARAVELNRPLRLTREEIVTHPVLGSAFEEASRHLSLDGWLSTPLAGRDGRNMGLVQVSDRIAGEFTAEDESALTQLAQAASIAIENMLYREAREANRVKDEFLATLSHELRTPLNAMLGWTGLLRTGRLDAETTANALETIERNVRTQAKMIDDLLDVSRIITGKLRLASEPLSLAPVVEAAVNAMRPVADAKQIGLDLTLSAVEDRVSGDADRLTQVVFNLLSNAIKFTPGGGRIEIRLEQSGGDLELTVRDTGTGISPELLPHIFDRFWQADASTTRAHGGLGLGLAIVHHVVGLHGGIVRAESPGEGQGATFTVRLPVLVEEGSTAGAPGTVAATRGGIPATGVVPSLNGLRILVVDDEADVRDLVAAALERRGATVITVGSVADALTAVDAFDPDVLVSDIAMPGEDGYSLIQKLRARATGPREPIPAIALTALAKEEDRLNALAAGFQLHLTKPVELRVLIGAVASLAASAAGVEPRATSVPGRDDELEAGFGSR